MLLKAWVGLGSNQGDRRVNLSFGLEQIRGLGRIQQVSSIYETAPWGKKDQPPFLNAVCSLSPEFQNPQDFYLELTRVETKAGRVRADRWGPRTLDLDLLLWGNAIISTEGLMIPHPFLERRRFVLTPLAEVAPDLIHPLLGSTMRELLDRCPDDGAVKIWGKLI